MKKILLLEDEEIIGKIYKKNLINAGYEVIWTKSVEQSIGVLDKFNPDIALIDHGIKGKKSAGIDLIKIINKNCPKTYIVMLSNYSEFHMRDSAIKAGANDYLVKINTAPKVLVKYLDKISPSLK